MNKYLAFIIVTIALNSTVFYGQNIIFTENFELKVKNLKDKGWSFHPRAILSTEKSFSGNKSLKIESTNRKQYASIRIPVIPGKRYNASIMMNYKNVRKKNRGAVVFLQLADKRKRYMPGGSFEIGLYGSSNDKWVQYKLKHPKTIPEQARYIQLLVGIEGTGTAYFDDLKLYEIPKDGFVLKFPKNKQIVSTNQPEFKWENSKLSRLLVSKDKTFQSKQTFRFYDTNNSGQITATHALEPGTWFWKVDNFHSNEIISPVHSFVIPEGLPVNNILFSPNWINNFTTDSPLLKFNIYPHITDKELKNITIKINKKEAKIISLSNNILSFQPAQKINNAMYTIEVKYKDQYQTFYYDTTRNNKTITFRKDNVMLIDGKAFFPIGAYRDPSDSLTDFSGTVEAGFNMIHNYAFEHKAIDIPTTLKYLNNAEKNDLKVFLGLPRQKIKSLDTNYLQKYCSALKNHNALAAWYMLDEPSVHQMPYFALEKISKAVKAVDKTHPQIFLFCKGGLNISRQYTDNILDIYSFDDYPVRNATFDTFAFWDTQIRAKQAAKNKPYWAVVQGSDLNIWPDKIDVPPRYPTPAQTRLLAHMLLAAGADGLIWYWQPRFSYHIKNDAPIVWSGICKTVKEIKSLIPFLTGDKTLLKIKVPNNIKYWSAKNKNNDRVLSIMNISNKTSNFRIQFNDIVPKFIQDSKTKKKYKVIDKTINMKLQSYEVKLFKWKENSRLNKR